MKRKYPLMKQGGGNWHVAQHNKIYANKLYVVYKNESLAAHCSMEMHSLSSLRFL